MRREFTRLGVLGLVVVLISSGAVAVGTAVGETQTSDATVSQPDTLEGTVTTEPVSVGDRQLLGTDRGLYVLSDGDIERRIDTQPVREVTPIGGDRVVVVVENEFFSNVQAFDVDSGEMAWETGETIPVYSPEFGQVERRAQAVTAEPIGDATGGEPTDVAITAGKHVIAVDGDTGERRWTVEYRVNVWDLATVEGTVYAGTQDGHVLAIDGEGGDVEYETRLAEPFDLEDETVPRSVWDVEAVTIGGADRLAITTEDGRAHLVDPSDGDAVWSQQVADYDEDLLEDYYANVIRRGGSATIPGDATFFNLELTVVERGQQTDLAVAVTTEEFPHRISLRDSTRSLHLLDGADGTPHWENTDVDLTASESVVHANGVGDGSLLVPQTPRDSRLPLAVVDLDTGTADESLDVTAVPPQRRVSQDTATTFLAAADGEFVVAPTTGDTVVVGPDGEIRRTYPALRDVETRPVDATGDGDHEVLLVSRDAVERTGGEPQSRGLVLRDGETGEALWSHLADVRSFSTVGGYGRIQPVEATDGTTDLLALRQGVRGEASDRPQVVVIDGEDGTRNLAVEPIDDDPRARILSVVTLGDVTGNGAPDALVGEGFGVSVVDLESGDRVWERSYTPRGGDVEQWRPFAEGNQFFYHAVGGGGDADDVVVYTRDGQIGRFSPSGTGEDLAFEPVHESDLGGDVRPERSRTVGDRTGDGYEELLLEVDTDSGPALLLYAPADGTVIERFAPPWSWRIRPVEADFAGDGTPGTVAATIDEDRVVSAYTGGTERFSYEFDEPHNLRRLGIERVLPAAPAGDVDGDGADELAVVNVSRAGGAHVELYDVGSGERVETVVLERYRDGRSSPGAYAERIPDRTGDGHPEIGVVADVGGSSEIRLTYYVVDPQTGEILVSGDRRPAHFLALDGGVGLLEPDGALSVVDPTRGATLETSTDADTLDVSWSFDADGDYVTRVYVDGRPVDLTRGTGTTVRLPPGEHTVEIRATDRDGVTVHEATTVETTAARTASGFALFGATAGAVGLLVLPYGIRRLRG